MSIPRGFTTAFLIVFLVSFGVAIPAQAQTVYIDGSLPNPSYYHTDPKCCTTPVALTLREAKRKDMMLCSTCELAARSQAASASKKVNTDPQSKKQSTRAGQQSQASNPVTAQPITALPPVAGDSTGSTALLIIGAAVGLLLIVLIFQVHRQRTEVARRYEEEKAAVREETEAKVRAAELAAQKTVEQYKDVVEKEKAAVREEADSQVRAADARAQKTIEPYKDFIDRDGEIAKREVTLSELAQRIKEVTDTYAKDKAIYDKLRQELAMTEEALDIQACGLYKPHFDFDTPTAYKMKLEQNYDKQKASIAGGTALWTPENWSVNGSLSEGKKMVRQYSKLVLRAFNGECDALITKVRWNNVNTMEQRIEKTFETINQSGSTMGISITKAYLKLKLEELYLTHEYEQKLYAEKEEQRRIQEQIREEEKLQKEAQKAQQEAEEEERRYQKALERAKLEMEEAKGEEVNALARKISDLEEKLQKAEEQKQRAISQAQMTKSGHVYIISNIGSFGEDVLKIGMTRRLEPLDRVRELGDASVPFAFDVHAMIYSENAPELECELHNHFDERRVNLVNDRKEFYRVTLEELERFAADHKLDLKLTKLAEAREYRETMAMRAEKNQKGEEPTVSVDEELPASLA